MAIDKNDILYVAESGINVHRVQMFDTEGKPLGAFAGTGAVDHFFSGPHAVATNTQGEVFVADAGASLVHVFDHQKPALQVRDYSTKNTIIKAKQFSFVIAYNQSFKSCPTAAGTSGRVVLPTTPPEQFGLEVKRFKIPSGTIAMAEAPLTNPQVEQLRKIFNDNKSISVRILFVAECSDKHTVRKRFITTFP